MNYRTIQILIAIFFVSQALEYGTGQIKFKLGKEQTPVKIPSIENPLVILSLNDVDYKSPFSVSIEKSIIQRNGQYFLNVICDIKNSTVFYSQASITVKYLVTPQLKGFQFFNLHLSAETHSHPIAINPNNLQNLKHDYFVTSFSDSTAIDLISVTFQNNNSFQAILNTTNPSLWVQISFILLDVSAQTGCPTHNLFNGALNSFNRMTKQTFNFTNKQSSELVAGLSKLSSSSGTFEWDYTQYPESASAYGRGKFEFIGIQVDTNCAITNNPAISLSSQLLIPNINEDIKKDIIPLPSVFPIINQNIQPFTPIKPFQQAQPLQQVFQPEYPIIQSQKNSQQPLVVQQIPIISHNNLINVIPTTQIKSQPVVQNNHFEQNILPPPTLAFTHEKQPEIQTQLVDDNHQYYNPQINTWKIIGFVGVAWVGISIIAIPVLFCLLWRSRKRQEHQDEIIKKYTTDQLISEPAQELIDRGTDVRLKNNPVNSEIKPQVQHIAYDQIPSVVSSKNGQNTEPSDIVGASPSQQQSSPSSINPVSSIKQSNISQPRTSEVKDLPQNNSQIKSNIKSPQSLVQPPRSSIQKPNSQIVTNQSSVKDQTRQDPASQKIQYDEGSGSQSAQQVNKQDSPAASEIKKNSSIQSNEQNKDEQKHEQQQKNEQKQAVVEGQKKEDEN